MHWGLQSPAGEYAASLKIDRGLFALTMELSNDALAFALDLERLSE